MDSIEWGLYHLLIDNGIHEDTLTIIVVVRFMVSAVECTENLFQVQLV
jgi:hypothetical protein